MVSLTSAKLNGSGKVSTAGLVIAKSGRNAVQFGKVSLHEGETSIVHGLFTPDEARDLVNGAGLAAPDGNPIRFTGDGELEVPPVPNAVIVRNRPAGAASVFDGLTRPQAA